MEEDTPATTALETVMVPQAAMHRLSQRTGTLPGSRAFVCGDPTCGRMVAMYNTLTTTGTCPGCRRIYRWETVAISTRLADPDQESE